jgi:hypothetical protein
LKCASIDLPRKNEKNMKIQTTIILGALALAGFQAQAQWGLVQNGGFETGDLTDWSLTGNTGFFNIEPNSYGYGAHTGDYYVYFGEVGSEGLLSQTVADTVGGTYDFSFWLAGNGSGYSDVQPYWNGVSLGIISPVPNEGYTQYSYLVTGTGSDTLTLGLRNDPSYDALDDVSLTPVGAPDAGSSLALMATSLTGLCGLARKLRRK